jgi:DDE superfamily endonuclease
MEDCPSLSSGDRQWYTDGHSAHYAFVHWGSHSYCNVKQLKQWLNDMKDKLYTDYLAGEVHLILDRAPWHTSREAGHTFSKPRYSSISKHFIPAAGGKWLNPCDQAIHRVLRQKYRALQVERPRESLRNIIAAYYSVTEQCVLGSWKSTALLQGNIQRTLEYKSTEGYHAPKGKAAQFCEYQKIFTDWASMNFRRVSDVLPAAQPCSLVGSTLDGRQHTHYIPSRKRPVL